MNIDQIKDVFYKHGHTITEERSVSSNTFLGYTVQYKDGRVSKYRSEKSLSREVKRL